MKRLTDDQLSQIGTVARQARRHDDETCDGCYSGECAAMENAFEVARGPLVALLDELRERRAADLTAEEVRHG